MSFRFQSFPPELFIYPEPFSLVSPSSLACDLCGGTVRIEKAVTDEYGQAVHPECYLAAIKRSRNRAGNGFTTTADPDYSVG